MIQIVENELIKYSNPAKAAEMKAYMKNHFEFLGIQAPIRKNVFLELAPFLIYNDVNHLVADVNLLWLKVEREYQYFAIELLVKNKKLLNTEHLTFVEKLITNKSWWDSVDLIASNLLGPILKNHIVERDALTEKWMNSNDIWLQRSCVIHQLKYKLDTDTDYLSVCIFQLSNSNEFFIQKAIGWALRQYGKYNPEWVVRFVDVNTLKPLSRREALKKIAPY